MSNRLFFLVPMIFVTVVSGSVVVAQDEGYLNGVVDKLSRGERVYGVSTYDLSLENARSLARADIDYVYVDMEHGPMDFTALQSFLLGMIDKRAIAETGSLAAKVTPLARIAPYGRESAAWAVKQALDIGLMGIIFHPLKHLSRRVRQFRRCVIPSGVIHHIRSRRVSAVLVLPSGVGYGAYRAPTIRGGLIHGHSTRMEIWWP